MQGFDTPFNLIIDTPLQRGARYGLQVFRQALQKRCISFRESVNPNPMPDHTNVFIGTRVSKTIQNLIPDLPECRESLKIARIHNDLIICGSDDRGLMYALLDVAERITWTTEGDPLACVRDQDESPDAPERALSIYTMHRLCFEQRFFDPAYWDRYFDMLARNRFNTFALLFAYESAGYFAPPYPYFFNVPGYEEIQVVGMSSEMQHKHLQALNRLIEQAHAHGLDFTLGIWDHIYRGGVQQGPGQDEHNPLPWRVLGVTAENLMDYSVAAITELLKRVPNLDALQFRMHGESGLKKEEMDDFWGRIFDAMVVAGKGIRFDARAKGFPDRLVDLAIQKGVPIRICTKYWMEQMGLPFHPTLTHPQNQKDRRHSYANLLRYPQKYKIHWRLWNGGTSRILLWGAPDYVRRFVESTHLYCGDGFDVNEPLATKMASQDHFAPPFDLLKEDYSYTAYEFERYWHFFQLWGRIGYNPNTPSEIWERSFAERFGDGGTYLMQALHTASWILPRIVAYNYPYDLFPTTRGWVEKQRMKDLPEYASALPSDRMQFLGFHEAAQNHLSGKNSGRIHPLKTSAWFDAQADAVLTAVSQAEHVCDQKKDREFEVTITDLRILAQLARYHACRSKAGFCYAIFQNSDDTTAFSEAIKYEELAVQAWSKLVDVAGDVYAENLMMGRPHAGLSGHWKDELQALQEGLELLKQQQIACKPPSAQFHLDAIDPSEQPSLCIKHNPILTAHTGAPLIVSAQIDDPDRTEAVYLHYRHLRQDEDYHTVEMDQTSTGFYQATIPADFLNTDWDVMYLIEAVGIKNCGCLYPDLEKETPYIVVALNRNAEV